MANKRHKPEEIVTKLRQVEVPVGHGLPFSATRKRPAGKTRPSIQAEKESDLRSRLLLAWTPEL